MLSFLYPTFPLAGRARCQTVNSTVSVKQGCSRLRQRNWRVWCQLSSAPQPQQEAPKAAAHSEGRHASTGQWQQHAPDFLQRLGLAADTTPEQLWLHMSSQQQQQQQQQLQEQLEQAFDLHSGRLLLTTAAATCRSQQQLNQLHPLIQASISVFPRFELADFQQLLQLCAQARYIPDKEWLTAAVYADTGGIERLYAQLPPHDVVALFSDLSAMLGSHRQLFLDTQQHVLKQQQAVQEFETLPDSTTVADLAAEVEALQAALQRSTANLMEIQQDSLLAGELSAVGGYWLLRRLLPQLQGNIEATLLGLTALPGLNYQVLDAEDADQLLGIMAGQLASWDCSQLAAALIHCLPCLGEVAPSGGDSLALLFAAAGAAAAGMTGQQAGQVLVVLAQLPGYAPEPKVAQALLDRSLQPPVSCNARQLYMLLNAASELGAAPRPEHMDALQQVLNSAKPS